VLFILGQVGSWKTELLFQSMLAHPRFLPILGLVPLQESLEDYDKLNQIANDKGYPYVDLMDDAQYHSLWKEGVDIVFYQKPYMEQLPKRLKFTHHLNSLFCYVFYGCHGTQVSYNSNMELYRILWQYYFENEGVAEEKKEVMIYGGRDAVIVTGIPMFDSLSGEKNIYPDPWNKQTKKKKRIIYAPHHSLLGYSACGIEYATFLNYADFMLEMAVKYKEQVQWAFKPHPILKYKLYKLWGAARTDEYYSKWEELDNAQFEDGTYEGLFLHSDAMIHDCSSFTIEYLLTGNPVLYLVNGKEHHSNITRFAQEGYRLHYKAINKVQIEQFIQNVIREVDPMRPQRIKFRNEQLVAPYGKTATQNIIHAILGEAEYAEAH
jgi:CDP-glycerol glycerophosphotransferase (TagB/SpsB family)